MSVNWDAKCLIGCKIIDPHVTVKVRGCHHEESSSPFCAQCGKPMYKVSREISPVLAELSDYPKEGEIGVIHGNSMGEMDYYVGFCIARVSDNHPEKKVDAEKLVHKNAKDILKRMLKDLYKEENFGFWLVLDAG